AADKPGTGCPPQFSLTARSKKLFSKVAPDSEALYSNTEREFGVAKLESLYALLAEFYQTLALADTAQEDRSATG
ncbi:MAG: hypothetical protein ACR2Q3_02850, partial [Woeseiaceae bacterium]